MSRAICFAVGLFLMIGTPARAQGPGGSKCTMWRVQALSVASDSVLLTLGLVMAPDGKSWVMKLPDRAPVTARVLTMGGDSMVAEAGPFPSVLSPASIVTRMRLTAHVYNKKDMRGSFEARYEMGDPMRGRIRGSCADKK